MNIKKGGIVLDLGCGLGTTSIFLAKNFDATVIAVDLWNSPEILVKRSKEEGLSNRIIPVQIDITQVMPFAEDYFDAIFCMNSLFMFGDDLDFLRKLLKTLKKGGTFCLGSECFNQEPNYKNIDDVPKVYNFEYKWSVWEGCCSKYHCPGWWKSLFTETNMLDIRYCQELDDGIILWEDSALNYYSYYDWHKGITSEAIKSVMDYLFDKVEFKRIESRHDPRNPNSGAVMKKCGMKYEGTLRMADWNNQGICDACYYAQLASER